MSLRSRITGSDQTEADETNVDDAAAPQPTFTPAADGTADEAVPRQSLPADDVAAPPPTIVEPADAVAPVDPVAPAGPAGNYDASDYDAGNYAATDSADRVAPADSYTEVDSYTETDSYTEAEPDGPVTTAGTATDTVAPAAYDTATDTETSAGYETATDTDTAYETTPSAAATGAVAPPATGKHAAQTSAGSDLDQPLFSENVELRSRWQQVQADFVDDPQIAVAGAADLVNAASQALVDALRQRQQDMRAQWDRSGNDAAGTNESDRTTSGGADTEQLRLLMRRYRELFDQLCQPV